MTRSCQLVFQSKNALVEAFDQFPLFDGDRNGDAFERNCAHGVKIFRQVQFRRAENIVKKLLVVFAKSVAVLRPACDLVVDNVGEGRHCSPHRRSLLSQEKVSAHRRPIATGK